MAVECIFCNARAFAETFIRVVGAPRRPLSRHRRTMRKGVCLIKSMQCVCLINFLQQIEEQTERHCSVSVLQAPASPSKSSRKMTLLRRTKSGSGHILAPGSNAAKRESSVCSVAIVQPAYNSWSPPHVMQGGFSANKFSKTLRKRKQLLPCADEEDAQTLLSLILDCEQ